MGLVEPGMLLLCQLVVYGLRLELQLALLGASHKIVPESNRMQSWRG